MEYFYAETGSEKNKGALYILELALNDGNLNVLMENEPLMGALSRVFREDWKKNFDVGVSIARIFVRFSRYSKFHSSLMNLKVGSLFLSAVEHEVKRGECWLSDVKKLDPESARKTRNALKKQATLLSECITLLCNLAVDVNVELKMVRRDLVLILIRTLPLASDKRTNLALATVRFLLKLSIFEENKILMEQNNAVELLLRMFPIEEPELRRVSLKLLFNFALDSKNTEKMVSEGLVNHIAPLIDEDTKALNLLYLLSCNDDAKAMIAFTEAIQLLMKGILSGSASDVTKAVLLNVCIEKRNAQIVCGPGGQGLDLIVEQMLITKDLMLVKIVRAIGVHEGATQNMFLKWMSKLLDIATAEPLEDDAFALECLGTVAVIQPAPWTALLTQHHLVEWMKKALEDGADDVDETAVMNQRRPVQLQIVIACGTMARQIEAARALEPLIDGFIGLLQSAQVDDEFVVQLLFMFVQMLKHKELADRLMTPDSMLGAHLIDLMHDANSAVRETCDNALVIMEKHSQEWARRIAGERFRWHNAQWFEMIERGGGAEVDDDIYVSDVLFDQYEDGFDLNDPLF